jgi:hypothetical protein
MFQDKRLAGLLRQKVNEKGDLIMLGVIYPFGAQLPVYLIIKRLPKPDKKGKTIWGIFTHLRPQTTKGLRPYQVRAQWCLNNRRKGAEEKARKLLNIIGANYEYNKKGKDRRRKSGRKSKS